jgi:hypothetical protein
VFQVLLWHSPRETEENQETYSGVSVCAESYVRVLVIFDLRLTRTVNKLNKI